MAADFAVDLSAAKWPADERELGAYPAKATIVEGHAGLVASE
jgi:hypothetical protein